MIFDGDRDQLGEYVRALADLMGLRDWEIILRGEPPENAEFAACVQLIYGQRRASLFVASNWATRDPEVFRHTIVHELVHCHVNPIRDILTAIRTGIGDILYYTAHNVMDERLEYAVDGIATAWAETLPLPDATLAKGY